jgi:hypothetical protein
MGVVAMVVVLFLVGSWLLVRNLAGHDFIAFYAAAHLVASGHGAQILDPAAVLAAERAADPELEVLLPWVHVPAVALVLSPFALLPLGVAAVAMVVVDVACLVWSAYRLQVVVAAPQRPWLFVAALFSPPALFSLLEGQTTPAVLALVVFALGASPFRAGLALGLTLIRPQTALLFVLAGLVSRRSALGVLAGSGAVIAASMSVVGPAGMLRYALQLLDAEGWSLSGAYGLHASPGWVSVGLALGMPDLGVALAAGSFVVGSLVILRSGPLRARVIAASAWCVLASSHVAAGDILAMYPALALGAAASPLAGAAIVGTGCVVALLQLGDLPVGAFWLAVFGTSMSLALLRSRPRVASASTTVGSGAGSSSG